MLSETHEVKMGAGAFVVSVICCNICLPPLLLGGSCSYPRVSDSLSGALGELWEAVEAFCGPSCPSRSPGGPTLPPCPPAPTRLKRLPSARQPHQTA